MSVFLAKGRMRIAHEVPPKMELMQKLGDLSDFKLFGSRVLVAVYTMPKDAKTVGGLLMPEKVADENHWQGRSCLVVKLGPQAFVEDDKVKFNGMKAEVGDWVLVRAADGQSVEVNGVLCRIYQDTAIQAVIPDPDCVW